MLFTRPADLGRLSSVDGAISGGLTVLVFAAVHDALAFGPFTLKGDSDQLKLQAVTSIEGLHKDD